MHGDGTRFHSLAQGLPCLIFYLLSVASIFMFVYVRLTPHNEFKLVSQGNMAAVIQSIRAHPVPVATARGLPDSQSADLERRDLENPIRRPAVLPVPTRRSDFSRYLRI